MKAMVYARVSTEEQAEKGYSIHVQKQECINKAAEMGCSPENVYVFCDEGVSGAVLERPQLMAALDMLQKNNIEYFICYDGSRLSRNAAHQLILIDEIKKRGANLIFIKNSYQDNAEGRFQLTVMAAVDEYERARLKLRTEMGKQAKAAQHELTHNPGLYGYDFDPKTDTLSINDSNAKTLLSMFRMLIEEGKGPAQIAEILNASNVPSPRLRQWNRVTVRRILTNPSYLGTLFIRRYDTRDCHLNKFKSKGEKQKVREKPQNEWVPIQIPPLVDKITWEKAQHTLKKSKCTRKRKNSTDFLLTPLLKCGICGSTMRGKVTQGKGRKYRYYVCSGKYGDNREVKCASELFRAEDIEQAVWEYLCNNIDYYISCKADAEKLIKEFVSEKENSIRNILIKKEKANKEKERIILMFQKGYINEVYMGRKLVELEKQLKLLEASQPAGWIVNEPDYMAASLPIIIKKMLNEIENKERKMIIEMLLSEIELRADVISIIGRLV